MIGKPRGKNGRRPVYVYDPAKRRKVYVGARDTLKEAKRLEAQAILDLQRPTETPRMTCEMYVNEWLEEKHGPGTRRPALTTYRNNQYMIKRFLKEFGSREMQSIGRREALRWAREQPHGVQRTVAAMFNDAFDDEIVEDNPFKQRGNSEGRGRKDIHPLTEAEVTRLGEIALGMYGAFGKVVKAWILFAAWTGARPGEMWKLEWDHIDFETNRFRVKRVKGKKQTDFNVLLPAPAREALLDMGRGHGQVFRTVNGKPMNKGNAGYYWRPVRMLFEAELDEWRRDQLRAGRDDIDLYDLRHFCGSLLADRGLNEFDISYQLGNSPQVCREYYVHPHEDRTQDRLEMAFSLAAEGEMRRLAEGA